MARLRFTFSIFLNKKSGLWFFLAEHDIFGEPVSDSEEDDEDANINVMDMDDTSRLSAESRVSDSNSMQVRYSERSGQEVVTCTELVTEFSKEMFHPESSNTGDGNKIESTNESPVKLTKLENFHSEYMIPDNFNESLSSSVPARGNLRVLSIFWTLYCEKTSFTSFFK